MNKNANNANHSAKLEMFFTKKMEQDKINRKIKKRKKVSKKTKLLSFDFDKKQFRLVDENNVSSVSVSRTEKTSADQVMSVYSNQIQKSNKKILKTKYELLFEYQNIENYESIYETVIQQHELSKQKYGKIINDYKTKTTEKLKEYENLRVNNRVQQEPYELELKSDEGGDKSINKTENMRSYIEYQSELYELNCQQRIDDNNIDEIATKI
jgi:hypothetical protein